MTRIELLAKLEDEIAQGWPEPFWPQDRLAATLLDLPMDQTQALFRLFDLIADAAVEAWGPCWAPIPVELRAA